MTVTDAISGGADTLKLTIDDKDGRVAAPPTGAKLKPVGGYMDGVTRAFGDFIVDQVMFTGWPQQIEINARSVGAVTPAKQQKPQDFRKEEHPTYGAIFARLASAASLTPMVSPAVAAIANLYEHQGEENPLECVTRIARKLGAIVMVKSGKMIVIPRGSSLSLSGASMPAIMVKRGVSILSYSAKWLDGPRYGSVAAAHYDRKQNKRLEFRAPTGMDGPEFLIREMFQSPEEAQRAAGTRADELMRSQANASFSINGDPTALAGASVVAAGCRPGVDGRWYAKQVTHNFSATDAYTTDIECELPTFGSNTVSV